MTELARKPIDAVIKDAVLVGKVVTGKIYADTQGRFKDGSTIKTSAITAQYGDIVYTANSVYYVASWIAK